MKTLTEEQINQLKAPFPPEAITANPKKTFLSSIRAYYIIERMNDVFGVGQWQLRNEIIGTEKSPTTTREGKPATNYEVLAKATLDIPEYNIHLEQAGGSDDKVWGDAAKGAITDALNKCASYLYIGYDVFIGKCDVPKAQSQYQPQSQSQQLVEYHAPVLQKKVYIDFNVIKSANTIEELNRIYYDSIESLPDDSKAKQKAIEILGERKKALQQGHMMHVDNNLILND